MSFKVAWKRRSRFVWSTAKPPPSFVRFRVRERKKGTHTHDTREDPSTFSSTTLYFRVSKKKRREEREKERERLSKL
tara:strand:- start:3637 stop:3867 length:231 start_codon:yes stop_codon:yes gene_type:complete